MTSNADIVVMAQTREETLRVAKIADEATNLIVVVVTVKTLPSGDIMILPASSAEPQLMGEILTRAARLCVDEAHNFIPYERDVIDVEDDANVRPMP